MVDDTPLALSIGLPVALALIMGSLGLSLVVADFRRIATHPRAVAIGLANLLLLSPLLAFAIAEAFDLLPVLAAGLVLLGATPGGVTANLMTHLARGDTALSVSMTALSSIAAVITVPLYLGLAVNHFDAGIADDVSTLGVSARVLLITVVPLAIGMAIRHRHPAWALRNDGRAKKVAVVALFGVIVTAIVSEFETLEENAGSIALAALTLNVVAMASSYGISRLARLDPRQATAVAMELGVHNGTVAITVGALITEELAIPAAVYGLIAYFTAAAFARLLYRRNGRLASPEPA
jgi:BASS family bile acid:Na+ symporter